MGGVNRILWLWLIVAGCHVGRPPARVRGVSLGAFKVQAVEPGLADALRQGMSDRLASAGLLWSVGPEVEVEVLEASTRISAVTAEQMTATARLRVMVRLGRPAERSVVLEHMQSYAVVSGQPLEAAAARSAAFASMAQSISSRAVSWIRYAPEAESK